MAADVIHQTLDDQQGHDEGHHTANGQDTDFHAGDANTGQEEFQHLDGGCAQHGGDGHEEGEFRTGRSAYADEDRTQDGRAGTGRAGHQTQALEQADEQCHFVGDVVDIFHLFVPEHGGGRAVAALDSPVLALVVPLHQDEGDAVDDQGDRNHDAVVQVGIHPVIQQNTHHTGGNNGGDDLEPQGPGLALLFLALAQGKGIQLMEEQHDDRQDGAQLDHHIEHGFEFVRGIQLDELVQQNDMSRGGHGQPLGNALHNAE